MTRTRRSLQLPAGAGALLLALAAPAAAQSRTPTAPPAPAPAGDAGDEDDATVVIAPLPNWSIRPEVDRLDTSMREYNSLIQSLSKASQDLGAEFQRYLQNPHDEVLASSVERKMALYAQQVMGDFDAIIADQDLLGANFRDLRRKLVAFSDHLGTQAQGFSARLEGYRAQASAHEKRLVELSVRLKENPPEDPEELRKLKQDFAREFRAYGLQTRYVNGYQRRYRNYRQLKDNMEKLATLFVNLHDKFNELVHNLENERQYLQDSLVLQADTLRIKQIIRDGIVGSEQAIGNVADKLADLYQQVDAFGQVHERINSDLNRFVQSQEILLDITRKIDAIGTTGAGAIGDIGADMDRAIELFYARRNGEDEELLGVEDVPAEDEDEEAAEGAATPAPAAPQGNVAGRGQ